MTDILEGPVQDEQHEPEPGETWIKDDGTELIVVGRGYEDSKKHYDPTKVLTQSPGEKYNSTSIWPLDQFLEECTFDPGAQGRRDAELYAVTTRLEAITSETRGLELDLRRLGAGTEQTAEESTSTAISLTDAGGVEMADRMKRSVAHIRNQVQRNALKAKEEAAKMNSLIQQNVMAVKAKMEGIQALALAEAAKLTKMVQAAEEVVWTFNLYLGKDETIVNLRDGEPAAKNEKIAIRQMVLYMDEESALMAEEGGIDFQTMEEFDNWIISDPKHLNQVLPNTRGIVAIKPRRMSKEYTGNPLVDANLNKMNKHTYFLIRNGERLFRIDTDLEVTDVLFPRENEFAELFEKTIVDWNEPRRLRKVKPGDEEYMQMMERSQGLQKHYMRVFLFLQGLLDRTTVFHPFEVPRVNVFDMNRQDEHIQFISDAETSHQLGEGRPSFDKWLNAINKKLEVGMRVIGLFKTSDGGHSRSATPRTHPAWSSNPSDDELHTIERHDGRRYYFLYERTDTVWRGRYDEDGPAKKRASIWFTQEDDHWIAYDLATVEDMEYYLRSRQNRQAYERMFPVLKRAIELKKEEEAEERPFRAALAGALMRDHSLTQEAAEKEVNELVHWWKYKNKIHRALLSDDEKAARMILSEYKRKEAVAVLRTRNLGIHRDIAAVIHGRVPDVLAIYHKNYNEYVVFRPENESNVFVNEELWKHSRGVLSKVGERRWVTTNPRRIAAWGLLFETLKWAAWNHHADPKKFLTDEEAAAVYAQGVSRIKRDFLDKKERKEGLWNDPGQGTPVFIPLGIYFKDNEWNYWFQSRHSKIPKRALTSTWSPPTIMRADISWWRNDNGKAEARVNIHEAAWFSSPFCPPEKFNDYFDKRNFPEPLWIDSHAVACLAKELEVYHGKKDQVKLLQAKVERITVEVKKAMEDALLTDHFNKFQSDYGDPDLWEAHKATIKMPFFQPQSFSNALPYLVEQGEEVVGMTVAEVFERARSLGWKGELEPQKYNKNKNTIYLAPMDHVIKGEDPPPQAAEDSEEDGDDEELEEDFDEENGDEN